MVILDPDFVVYCCKMGSSEGSRSVPTFSSNTNFPN